MATKTFGAEVKTPQDYVNDLHRVAGTKFPLSISVLNGKITAASYDTEWKDGGTTPIEVKDKKTGEISIEYQEDYSNHKLTAAQIKKIDTWLEENIEA